MYKTVRQGDASLQYTIVPQIDQFYVNERSTVPGTSPRPVRGHHCSLVFRITPAAAVVSIFICCAIGTYLIDQAVTGPCADTNLQTTDSQSVTNEIFATKNNHKNEHEKQENIILTATSTSQPTKSFQTLGMRTADKQMLGSSSRATVASETTNEEEPSTYEFTIDEVTPSSVQESHSTTYPSSTGRTSSSSSVSTLDKTPSTSEETTKLREGAMSAPTNSLVNILTNIDVMKMPRVTLKLGMNDTIPQMYMKAGVTSYKKGKITTSVLAQGLSLEGLIFKTPEGTIKPWREKWPFVEQSDIFKWKHRVTYQDLIFIPLSILMIVSVVVSIRLLKTFDRRVWQKGEDPEMESQDEAQSNLLEVHIQEPEDKD